MSRPAIHLVATDLDGTLLRSDGTVSDATVEALAALEAAGLIVVFVTARPVRWVRELVALVHGHGLVICANGAIVYDARTDREVLHGMRDRRRGGDGLRRHATTSPCSPGPGRRSRWRTRIPR